MRKSTFIYIILIVLIIIIIFWIQSNRKNIVGDTNQNFSVENIEDVTQISLFDRKGDTIHLRKINNHWIVNTKYKVREDAISILLNTIKEVKIKRTIPKRQYNTVVKNLATTGVKIEIYTTEKKPDKIYTIGGNTPDHLGNYMVLDNSKEPCIVHIPGFNGFLTPSYGIQENGLNENIWRDTQIFGIKMEQIKYLSLEHLTNTSSSFSLSTSPLELRDHNNAIVPLKKKNIIRFLNSFNKLHCESFKSKEDIINKKPIHRIIVSYDNKVDTLETYNMRYSEDIVLKENSPNVERMYAILNNNKVMLIQLYVFNKVLITINELQK